MSVETALKFLEYAQQHPELQEAIGRLRGANTLDRLLEIAQAHDFTFSKDDYRAAVAQLAEGELSSEAIKKTAQSMGLEVKE